LKIKAYEVHAGHLTHTKQVSSYYHQRNSEMKYVNHSFQYMASIKRYVC